MPARTRRNSTSDSYFELIERFPLRRIRTETERAAAAAIIRELAVRGETNLDAGQIDYLEALAGFIADFERSQSTLAATPLDVLKHLLHSRNMRPADLGRLIGRSAATMVLRGQRELSKAQIRKLAAFFGVGPGILI